MKKTHLIVFLLFLFTFLPWIAAAEDLSPDFQRAITLSREHADNPTSWVPDYTAGDKRMVTITGNPATENTAFGLKYDTNGYGDGKNYLIVRTLGKTDYMGSNYVNQPDYKVFGKATESAYWVTTGNEATKFLQDNKATSTNWVRLMERGLGMKDDNSHTAMVEYAVIADNDHILRPSKNSDIKTYSTTASDYGTNAKFPTTPPEGMTQATYDNYVGTANPKLTGYYEYWKKKTYDSAVTSSDAFPWTQIGYTFLWGNGEAKLANIQGLSEFILLGGTSVQIYGIYAPQSYIYTLNKDGAFSTAADAQYGNGFGSFKIDGTCDTVWAGHRFQRNVSTGAANQINITNTGSLSGGQGLLIWSLNYAVDNQGTISGATANKFATTDTANIAVLFKGDTTKYGSVTAPTGSNTLTNSGTISSPGTAIKAEAGDTNITNNAGGLIEGVNYAIQTGAGNDTVTVNGGNINGTVDLGTGIDKLVIKTGATVTGAINTRDNATVTVDGGTLYMTGGAISANGITGGNNNDTVTVENGTVTGTVDLGTGIDKLVVKTGATVTGAIYTGNRATVTMDGGTLNMTGGVISANGITGGSNNDTVKITGGEITGKVDLGTGTDTFNVTGAKLNFTLNRDTASSAQVLVKDAGASTVSIADSTKLAVTVTGKNVQNNNRFLIVDTDALTVTPANLVIQNDSTLPMVSFSAMKDGNQLYLVAARNSSYYGANSGNSSLGNLLDSLANSSTGDMANVLGDLDKSGDAGNARKMEPTVDRGTVQAGFATNAQVTRTIINRMVEFRAAGLGPGESGISTGDEPAKWGVWTQGFGTYMKQAAAGSSNGYTANIWGGSMGFDRLVYNNVLVGLSGSYARNNIGTADVNTRTNADSYQGNFYGSLARDAYYMNGILSYAYNRYDASRHIVFGTTNRIATSNYGGQQYSAYAEGGYGFKKSGFDITPLLSLQYMRLHINDYAESGADSLNLNVDAQRYNMFQSGLGAKLAYPIVGKDLRFIPEVHAKWLYDFVGDSQQASSTFTGGGASFATQGFDPSKSSYNLGATFTVMTAHNVTLTLNYDFEMKTDFYSHNGYFNLRYVF